MSTPDKKEIKTTVLSLEQAIKNGDAVLKSSVDSMIAEEMEKNMANIKEEMRTQINKEAALEKIAGAKGGVESFLSSSGLGDRAFASRLMALNISPKMAKYLRDDHVRLTDAQLWEYIRNTIHDEKLMGIDKNKTTIGQ